MSILFEFTNKSRKVRRGINEDRLEEKSVKLSTY